MEEKTYTYKYPHPAVTADCVIFGYDGKDLKILLIERGLEPYKGYWAFPGGFMNIDETVEECARRELKEETGLEANVIEQFHTFSKVDRDPRERVITIAFIALVKQSEVVGGDDAAKAQWFALKDVPQLAFDHDYILRLAQRTLKEKIHFEPICFELMDEEFSMPELQRLYEAILEVKFDRRNFEKKMTQLGILDQIYTEDDVARNEIKVSDPIMCYRDFDSLFEERPSHTMGFMMRTFNDFSEPRTRGRNRKFRFNKQKYEELKKNGKIKMEF